MPRLKPIVLDGRTLEGGGQLLRNALCLAALTKTPITIENIRGNRSGGGGLKAQHLACVQWLAHACEAKVSGAHRGSTELDFHPKASSRELSPAFTKKKLATGEDVYEAQVDIGTAGSTTLALQAVLPFVLFSAKHSPLPVHLTLTGGTNVSASPSYEYISQVLFPTLHAIGLPLIVATLKRRGMNSIGCIELLIPPITKLPLPGFTHRPQASSLIRNPSAPRRFQATFIGSDDLHDQIKTILPKLISQFFPASPLFPQPDPSPSSKSSPEIVIQHHPNAKGFYLLLTATSQSSSDNLSHPYILAKDLLTSSRVFNPQRKNTGTALQKALESIVKELAREWSSGAWVDEHLRDQIVIYRGLAAGRSEVCVGMESDGGLREASLHTQTAEWVVKTMLRAKFDEDGNCDGCGFMTS